MNRRISPIEIRWLLPNHICDIDKKAQKDTQNDNWKYSVPKDSRVWYPLVQPVDIGRFRSYLKLHGMLQNGQGFFLPFMSSKDICRRQEVFKAPLLSLLSLK